MTEERLQYRSGSRLEWRTLGDWLTTAEVQAGCLQRIADALEKVVPRYDAMQDSLALYKRWHEEEKQRRRKCERRIAALQGVITRVKRQQKPKQKAKR